MDMNPAYEWLKITVVGDKDATVAYGGFEGHLYTASAKRAPGDKYDEDIGYELAVSRLLGKISRHLERRATGAVRNADHIRRGKITTRQLRERYVAARISETFPTRGRHRRHVDHLHQPFDLAQ